MTYVRIFTDSQATLQALHNPHVTSKLIEETIAQLNLLGQTVKSLTICLLYTSDAADE